MAKPKGSKGVKVKKQKLVDNYFLNGGSMTKAALDTGYSPGNIKRAHILFKDSYVQELIAERKQQLREKFEAKFETIIDELGEIVYGYKRLAKYKKVDEKGNLYWDFTGATEEDLAFITSMDTEVKFEEGEDEGQVVEVRKIKISHASIADAKSALDSIAKLIGIDKNRVELSGPDGKPIQIDDKEVGRRIAFLLTKSVKEESN